MSTEEQRIKWKQKYAESLLPPDGNLSESKPTREESLLDELFAGKNVLDDEPKAGRKTAWVNFLALLLVLPVVPLIVSLLVYFIVVIWRAIL